MNDIHDCRFSCPKRSVFYPRVSEPDLYLCAEIERTGRIVNVISTCELDLDWTDPVMASLPFIEMSKYLLTLHTSLSAWLGRNT